MRKDNPAVYERPKDGKTLHSVLGNETKTERPIVKIAGLN